MRRRNQLQNVLYLIMVLLGIYIVLKIGHIFLQSRLGQSILNTGAVQRALEDGAVQTFAPGYAVSMQDKQGNTPVSGWMKQTVPVYSYLAEGYAGEMETEESEQTAGKNEITDLAGEITEMDMLPDTEMRGAEETETGETVEEGRNTEGRNTPDAGETEGRGSETGETEAEGRNTEGSDAEEADTGANGDEGIYAEESETGGAEGEGLNAEETESARAVNAGSNLVQEEWDRLEDYNYLLNTYFTVDGGTTADEELLDGAELLNEDLRIVKNPSVPQILIYHTHSQEAFADSVEGEVEDTIVGIGGLLAEILEKQYGYQVIHDTGVYDLVDGVLDRSKAYDYARASVEQILQENPTIEVVLDLHRDGVEGEKFVTEIDGNPVSKIMFFNGISRDSQDQPLYWLENPYVQQNLAFSLQLQLKARTQYPDFTRNIYLKAERYNLHLRPRSLLIEAGTQLNTLEEERNAMAPLAELLDQVLSGR